MPQAAANGIQIEYETFGDHGARPLLLTMGLGAQLVLWDEAFCEALAVQIKKATGKAAKLHSVIEAVRGQYVAEHGPEARERHTERVKGTPTAG